jgi:uncharacterized damage-inducible protein DinB
MMSNNPSLITLLYRHNLWSNLRLCDACLILNEEQLSYSDAGSYGSIQRTLTHLVRAEERYLYHLIKWQPTHPSKTTDQPTIADLKDRLNESGRMLLQTAATINPDENVQLGDSDEYIPAAVILLQAIHHAHEHRTQITSMLGQLNLDPPDISGWYYYDQEMKPD